MPTFPKSARLRRTPEFRHTLDNGSKTVCPGMVLFAQPRGEGQVRLGLIVSRKVGESVVRNRVKRRLREAFRHLRPQLDSLATLKGMDVVVVARHTLAKANGPETALALENCLKRLSRQVAAKAEANARPN